jgi:hypothetical protein
MIQLNKKIQQKFDEMCQTGKLFEVELTGRQVWDLYLNSFTDGNNVVFRDPQSSEHNCNHCNNFIRRYGNVVAINENYEVVSMFDLEDVEEEYANPMREMAKAIKKSKIANIFTETYNELNALPYEACSKNNSVFKLGTAKNEKRYTKEEAEKYGVVRPNEVRSFNHFHLLLPVAFVSMSNSSKEHIQAIHRDNKQVFQRAMEEIPLDTLCLVRDLALQGSLRDIDAHLPKVLKMIEFRTAYMAGLTAGVNLDNWCWITSNNLPIAKFKNELIGVFCSELAEGKELNEACKAWNIRVDPANWMKAVAPFTEAQRQKAIKTIADGGYEESFKRRFATIADVKADVILHMNVENESSIKGVSMFDGLKTPSTQHKRNEFEGIETIPVERFMKDILPYTTSIEAYLQNNHTGNMVSLTTAENPNSKPIFKWDNNYSWTFNGNLAGKSQIKEEVRSKGGKVDGVLRFSMMWADGNGDNSDLDLHCIEPSKNEIYFANRENRKTGGNLDIDITQPNGKLAVENITFPDLNRMEKGVYKLFIKQFSARGSKGFKAEIEFEGELFSYEYNKAVSGNVQIAEVTLTNGVFSIVHKLEPINTKSIVKEIYGLESNKFHKVNLVCLTPNHWGNNEVGNKHYLFMLEKCKSPNPIRSFHCENLISVLAEERKVLEPYGAVNLIESTPNQLSGLGFNATVRDELIVKLQGSHKRIVKILF